MRHSLRLALRFAAFRAALLALSILSPSARADTISSFTGSGGFDATAYGGQAFTISGTGSYNNIVIAFFTTDGRRVAEGTGFLFATPFRGSPGDLSAGKSNVLASTAAANGLYSFGPDLVLTSGLQYFFYENAMLTAAVQMGGPDADFASGSDGSAFQIYKGYSSSYAVEGTPVFASETPEPPSAALLATGMLAVLCITVLRTRRSA